MSESVVERSAPPSRGAPFDVMSTAAIGMLMKIQDLGLETSKATFDVEHRGGDRYALYCRLWDAAGQEYGLCIGFETKGK